ncbi:MAG: SpoIIIAH-like family protein [Clostridia bacterium]|nr:SpoIIIAH-like family protein [Clostridia bacterium]MBQ3815573.1 SpoIIIAH-like family protein [Clostridia bacterium]MBR4184691.1 SpoIIIAH-like family protein [Clostridia bacterium]MBR4895533.1 SpoIIIAH-like family protein [Clostridia bacterium]
MKEKLSGFWTRCREIASKAGARGVIALCAVVILGGAIALNFILGDDEKALPKLAVDLTSDGEAEQTLEAKDVEDYFASITLERRQARDEAIEVLKTVTESDTALADAKARAGEEISRIAAGMEKEANIEALMQSRGFRQCVAVLSDNACSVIVESEGLLQSEVAQISEIVWEQAGIEPGCLRIIEKSPGE